MNLKKSDWGESDSNKSVKIVLISKIYLLTLS